MVGPLLSRYTMHARVLRLSVVSNSLQPHGLYPTRLFCPWNFPGKDTGVGCRFLLQGIFLTQGSSLYLLHWQADSLPLSHLGRPDSSVQEPTRSPWPLILQGSPSSQSYASLSTGGTSTSFSLFPLLTAFGVLCDNWCARPAFLPDEEHAGCLDPTLLCLGGHPLLSTRALAPVHSSLFVSWHFSPSPEFKKKVFSSLKCSVPVLASPSHIHLQSKHKHGVPSALPPHWDRSRCGRQVPGSRRDRPGRLWSPFQLGVPLWLGILAGVGMPDGGVGRGECVSQRRCFPFADAALHSERGSSHFSKGNLGKGKGNEQVVLRTDLSLSVDIVICHKHFRRFI